MNEIEKSILNQLWIYGAALRTLIFLKLYHKYSEQVDITIDNMLISAQMLRLEAERQRKEIEMSVNVKV